MPKPSTPPTLLLLFMLPIGFVKNAAMRVRALPLPLLEVSAPTPPEPRVPGTGEIDVEEVGVPDPDEPCEEANSFPRSALVRPPPPGLRCRSLVGVVERAPPSRPRPDRSMVAVGAEARLVRPDLSTSLDVGDGVVPFTRTVV